MGSTARPRPGHSTRTLPAAEPRPASAHPPEAAHSRRSARWTQGSTEHELAPPTPGLSRSRGPGAAPEFLLKTSQGPTRASCGEAPYR